MGSQDNRTHRSRLLQSFGLAFAGMGKAFLAERNLQIHTLTGIVVIILAFLFQVSYIELLILLVVIGIVIALELINTAIERAVDLVTVERHPFAKMVKDTAAASVLFFSLMSVIIGVIIAIHTLFF